MAAKRRCMRWMICFSSAVPALINIFYRNMNLIHGTPLSIRKFIFGAALLQEWLHGTLRAVS